MSENRESAPFSESAFRATTVGPLPETPRERVRVGEELQPVGTYAGVIPYLGTLQDIDVVQEHEKTDPEFQSRDWWWDHERIRFLNGKLGLKVLVLIVPIAWVLFLWLSGPGVVVWGMAEILETHDLGSITIWLVIISGFLLGLGWLGFAIWVTPVTTNWIMSKGLGFVLKPFEKLITKKLDATLEDGCSEFNRRTGQVRIALGRGRFFEAPFVEFDAYVDRVIQQNGVFYRLIFVHRYTQKSFHNTAFSTIESSKSEVLAMWDVLQRYMDVTQPLPDVPRLEPFRHLDPVTAGHDRATGRNPRFWRDLDLETWKNGEGLEWLKRQRDYPWNQRACKLTPQLGRISMEEYRRQRPAGAWPI